MEGETHSFLMSTSLSSILEMKERISVLSFSLLGEFGLLVTMELLKEDKGFSSYISEEEGEDKEVEDIHL